MNSEMVDTPYPRSYWVIPRVLLAGYYPGDVNAEGSPVNLIRLAACGIRLIVNLMEDFEADHTGRIYLSYEEHFSRIAEELGVQLEYVRTPVRDLSVPSCTEMQHILNILDEAISRHTPVYVHCLGGLGRTGTVIGCFLARHGIATGEEALIRLKALRRVDALGHQPSPQTSVQQQFVCSWEAGE